MFVCLFVCLFVFDLRGSVTLIPIAERLAVELSLPNIFYTTTITNNESYAIAKPKFYHEWLTWYLSDVNFIISDQSYDH